MCFGTYLWHEKSILGWFGQPGQYWKKWGLIMSNFWGRFLCFHGQKNNFNFFWKYCSVCSEMLHWIEVIFFFKNPLIFCKWWHHLWTAQTTDSLKKTMAIWPIPMKYWSKVTNLQRQNKRKLVLISQKRQVFYMRIGPMKIKSWL